MKRISSRLTYFYKRIFPLLWFGLLTAAVVIPTFQLAAKNAFTFLVFIGPGIMAAFSYLLFKYLVFDLMDEAFDAGDHLIFKNRGVEETVRFENVMNISYTVLTNPSRVTLKLRLPNRLGKDISFMPFASLKPFKKSPIIDELIERVDRARER